MRSRRGNPSKSKADDAVPGRPSRRDFLKSGAAGLAGATLVTAGCRTEGKILQSPVAGSQGPLSSLRSATPADLQNLIGDGRKRRILLRGGVVLSLDSKVGDFEKADILIDGKTIGQIAPN